MKNASKHLAVCGMFAMGIGSACSNSPPFPSVHLSTTDPDSNADTIAAFFQRTCLNTGTDNRAFERSLARSGWSATPTQRQGRSPNGDLMPSVWRLEHGELIMSSFPAPAGTFFDCHLGLDASVAPAPERIRDALLPLVPHRGLDLILADENESVWTWPARVGQRWVLTIDRIPSSPAGASAADRPGLAIHVASDFTG